MEFRNLDNDTSVFFARELEHIKAQSYDVKYQDMYARMQIPVSGEAGAHATRITYRSYDRVGMAKIITAYAKDLPRADVSGREFISPVRSIGLSFAYNVDEILASAATGRSLEQRRANAVQRGTEESIDHIAWYGDASSGLPGFLTNPNVPAMEVATGVSGSTFWLDKTPDEILFDVNNGFATQHAITRQVEKGDTLMLPTLQYNHIAATPRSPNSDTTILAYIVANSPFISSADQIVSIPEMQGAGDGGTDLMVIYKKDPEKLTMEVPMELRFLAPQERGLEIEVPSWAKTGGTIVYYPMSIAFWYGIGDGSVPFI